MAHTIYNIFKQKIMTGEINFATDTLKMALVTNLYTVDIDNHTAYTNISNQVSASGYTTGGQTLTGVTVQQNLTYDYAQLFTNEAVWIDSAITASGAIIYKSASDPTQSWLIMYIDFNGTKSSYNSDFIVQMIPYVLYLW